MLSKVANPICVLGKPGNLSKHDLMVLATTYKEAIVNYKEGGREGERKR